MTNGKCVIFRGSGHEEICMSKMSMKVCLTALAAMLTLGAGLSAGSLTAHAAESDTIKPGIFAGSIDLSGKNEEEASRAVEGYRCV